MPTESTPDRKVKVKILKIDIWHSGSKADIFGCVRRKSSTLSNQIERMNEKSGTKA